MRRGRDSITPSGAFHNDHRAKSVPGATDPTKGAYQMSTSHVPAIETLSTLLLQWVDVAFPAQNRKLGTLYYLWLRLAEALCDSQQSKVAVFKREIGQLYSAGRAGEPPIQALEQRLHELVQGGLREYFLVIAVRQAMEQLLEKMYPSALEQWKQLANDSLPLSLQFALDPSEMPPGPRAILRPDNY